ncbi:MAG: helicase-exonuclease AddAB subunit AddB [Peptostreptococcus porci]|uniref:helicase-exonuclease AddAB subunit AddB n=1 Tax=Peptostreptococcus porci TaxID=2652282 RepID=UPI002A7530C7|nr:helicase-exonuclease AddAB subunit AddB [Peptostreptococcus porci]MDY2794374.1 helicase-exonuclease AddAB subunit AddB [Peptostreptococcus porci]MDY5479144.1 helicase-exonuclease AddAB subunit AddB [Peptostreptococcus porci]
MGVGFVIGRMDCNKTDKMLDLCFEESQKFDEKPIYYLVPEKYTYEIEKKLSNRLLHNKDPYFRIRVVSFSTLGNIVFTKAGGLKEKKISKSARNMIVCRAVDSVASELKSFKTSKTGIGIVGKLLDMIIEFKQNNMTVQDLQAMTIEADDEALKCKLSDISKVYEAYEKLIENKYFDTEDVYGVLARKVSELEELNGATIFVDEYTGFTPLQYDIIENLAKISKNMYFSLTTDLKRLNSKNGVFSKTNISYLKINEICKRNNIQRLKDINLNYSENKIIDDKTVDDNALLHLEKNISEFRPLVFSEKCDLPIRIDEFGNYYNEVDFVLNEVKRLVKNKGFRYNEITICSRNLDMYSHIIKGVFEKSGVNIFLDEKISAKNNPFIVLIFSILNMKKENFSYSSVFQYLKSGLVNIDNDSVHKLENFVLANGIKGKKWFDIWKDKVSRNVEAEDDEALEKLSEEIDEINRIRESVMTPISNLIEKLKGRNTVAEICKYLYEFTLEIELPQTLEKIIADFESREDLYKAKEYAQVWNIFVEMLDELVEFMGDEKIGIEKFINLMESHISEIELGIIPPARDQVLVTSIDRMKNPNTKALFILGVNDGVFPSTVSDNALISDYDKEKLNKSGVVFDSNFESKVYDEQFLVYKAMSSSKSLIYISYPLADLEGKSLRSSSLIKKIAGIFPSLKVITHVTDTFDTVDLEAMDKNKMFELLIRNMKKVEEDDSWKSVFYFFYNDSDYREKLIKAYRAKSYFNSAGKLSISMANELYNSRNYSVSRLEKYSYCPFSFFMTYGLKAKEREVYSFTPLDSGTYSHKILDEFSKNIAKDGLDWRDISENYISNQVGIISEKIFERSGNYILNTSEKYRYFARGINLRLEKSISRMVRQVREGDFNPNGFEVEFGFLGKNSIPPIVVDLDDGKSIKLRGKIDRVDIAEKDGERYCSVVDYKSSARSIDLDRVYNGLQLQLFVYMNAITRLNKNKKMKPAGLFYSNFNSKISRIENHGEYMNLDSKDFVDRDLSENLLSGLVIKDRDVVKLFDKNLENNGTKSKVVSVHMTKDGKFNSNSTKGLTIDEYEIVDRFVIEKSREICEDIYSGNIDIMPAKLSNSVPCDYCEYISVCKFDDKLKGNRYRYISKLVSRNQYDDILALMTKKLREED